MNLATELKKTIGGKPSQVRFLEGELKSSEEREKFEEQIFALGDDIGIASVSCGNDPERRKIYLQGRIQPPYQPEYMI